MTLMFTDSILRMVIYVHVGGAVILLQFSSKNVWFGRVFCLCLDGPVFVTIHKSRGSLYLEALSAQFGQKSPIVMSSHGTLPSITTDAPGLIPRTFLFLQHRDSHPGLPRKQTDKAVVINFFLSNKKT